MKSVIGDASDWVSNSGQPDSVVSDPPPEAKCAAVKSSGKSRSAVRSSRLGSYWGCEKCVELCECEVNV